MRLEFRSSKPACRLGRFEVGSFQFLPNKFLFLLISFLFFHFQVNSQVVYQPIQSSVYDFLDEMANQGFIELNTTIKPYSRKLIADNLEILNSNQDQLNKRQKKELAFYLKDFNKEIKPDKKFNKRFDLLYHKDSLFAFTLNPVLGIELANNSNGNYYHRYNGAEAYGSIGKHFGFAASLRDNGVTDIVAAPAHLTQRQGANYKLNQGVTGGRSDYSEAQGAITYGWGWGSVGIVKNNFVWGNNYNGSNIFSGKNPSYAYINLHLNPTKWIDFHYVHGWLVSEIVDSTRSYFLNGTRRRVYHDKYMAANIFTFTPVSKLQASFGNSVIYGDNGINPAYLIPFMFFKSIDHTYNGTGANDIGQNSQLFFDISSRNINKLHLYSSLFMDELSIKNVLKPDKQTNLFSWKIGGRATNIIQNFAFTAEYTRTHPWTYTHNIEVTTFESNQYNMGHYLRDNAEELFLGIQYKPIRGLRIDLNYSRAIKGPEIGFIEANGVNNIPGSKWIEEVVWFRKAITLKATYEILNDGFVFMEFTSANTKGDVANYSPTYFQGNTNTVFAGINFGF